MAAAAFEEGGRYRALKALVGAPSTSAGAGSAGGAGMTVVTITTQVGVLMKAAAQKAFVEQRRDGKEWRARKVPNVFGIIADLAEDRRPPARRWEERPAGRDTGQLYGSLAFRLVRPDTVEVGSVLPHAGVINFGGKVESRVIDKKVRDNLYRFLYGARGKAKSKGISYKRKVTDPDTGQKVEGGVTLLRSEAKKALGWLFNKKFDGKRLTATLPPRPFVAFTKNDEAAIVRAIGVLVARIR